MCNHFVNPSSENLFLKVYSIRINDRWRVCFAWRDGDAYDVEIVDYH